MALLRNIFLYSALAAGALGCSDDDQGVAGSANLSALSESEVKSLCEEFVRVNAKVVELQCTATVLEVRPVRFTAESCEEQRQVCVTALTPNCEAEDLRNDFADCSAKVSELRACQRDQARQFEQAYAGISCESDFADYANALDEIEISDACLALVERCPSAFEDEDGNEFAPKGLRRFAPRAPR